MPKPKREILGTSITKRTEKQLQYLRQCGVGFIGEIIDVAVDAYYNKALRTLTVEQQQDAPKLD